MLRRINLLYAIFFAAIVLAVVSFVLSDDARAAFRDGYRAGLLGAQAPVILYEIQNRDGATAYDLPLRTLDPAVEAHARIHAFDVQLSGRGLSSPLFSWSMVLSVVALLAYGAIFILIFKILGSLRRNFRTGNVFERRNIRLTKAIGKVLVLASLLNSTTVWLNNRAAARWLAATSDIVVDTSFTFIHSQIIMAILILFIAEVFAIGYEQMEEQKLTI